MTTSASSMTNAKPPDSRPIEVVWQCGMGAQCVNTEEQGKHRGDNGYEVAQACVHQFDPTELKKLRQR